MAAVPAPPPKRLRMKTPDPAKRHKSPDARSLKKAYKDLKAANKGGKTKGDASDGDQVQPRKLTFAKEPKITEIVAQNEPKTKPPKTESRMTTDQADAILAQFAKNKSAASASETEVSQARKVGILQLILGLASRSKKNMSCINRLYIIYRHILSS